VTGLPAGSGATIRTVSVFKQSPRSHMHVRTPVTIGVIVLLVVLLSSFCYYRVSSAEPTMEMQLQQWL
jgi:hypothetical protein